MQHEVTRPKAVHRRIRALGGAAALGLAAALLAAVGAAPPAVAGAAVHTAAALHKPRVPAGVYWGVDPAFQSGVGTGQQAATFTGYAGRPPAIVSFYISWTSPLPSDLAAVSAAGSVPMINWKCGPTDESIVLGGSDQTIRSMAEALKAFGRPVFLRWFWEMNLPEKDLGSGGHQPCLGPNETTTAQEPQYRNAWQRIWTIFQQVGATNVAFVWGVSAAQNAPDGANFYPCAGSSSTANCKYVDWIAGDVYDRPTYKNNFSGIFAKFYGEFAMPAYGKPMMLAETGATGSSEQVPWLEDIQRSLDTEFAQVHAVVYVDATTALDSYILQPGTAGMATYQATGQQPHFGDYDTPVDTYGFATSSGTVHVYDGYSFGEETGQSLPARIVGFAFGPDASGYWLVGADGSVYAFGSVKDLGSMRGQHLNKPIVAMAATPDGRGYWLVASDGGMFSYGDARFLGSTGDFHLNKPIVGMASTGDGHGYWLVASDGGMFAFGDAKFRGSMGGQHLNKPIDGMASTGDGRGYWLVASDGGIFSFGDAHYGGSLAGAGLTTSIVSAARDLLNGYYVALTAGGSVYQFPGGTLASTVEASSPAVQIATSAVG
jgi:hypothetical protein